MNTKVPQDIIDDAKEASIEVYGNPDEFVLDDGDLAVFAKFAQLRDQRKGEAVAYMAEKDTDISHIGSVISRKELEENPAIFKDVYTRALVPKDDIFCYEDKSNTSTLFTTPQPNALVEALEAVVASGMLLGEVGQKTARIVDEALATHQSNKGN